MDEDVGGDKVCQHTQNKCSPGQEDPEVRNVTAVTAPGPSKEVKHDQSSGGVGSTSSLTMKLNKLNCESNTSISDEPKPGPSNSAADFDLEVCDRIVHDVPAIFFNQVFDSGSSCSNEECWELDKEGSKVKVSTVQSSLATSSSHVSNPTNNSQTSDKVRKCNYNQTVSTII